MFTVLRAAAAEGKREHQHTKWLQCYRAQVISMWTIQPQDLAPVYAAAAAAADALTVWAHIELNLTNIVVPTHRRRTAQRTMTAWCPNDAKEDRRSSEGDARAASAAAFTSLYTEAENVDWSWR